MQFAVILYCFMLRLRLTSRFIPGLYQVDYAFEESLSIGSEPAGYGLC